METRIEYFIKGVGEIKEEVRKEMGYECAGATLGHTNMSATAIYAERNQGLADEAAKRFG